MTVRIHPNVHLVRFNGATHADVIASWSRHSRLDVRTWTSPIDRLFASVATDIAAAQSVADAELTAGLHALVRHGGVLAAHDLELVGELPDDWQTYDAWVIESSSTPGRPTPAIIGAAVGSRFALALLARVATRKDLGDAIAQAMQGHGVHVYPSSLDPDGGEQAFARRFVPPPPPPPTPAPPAPPTPTADPFAGLSLADRIVAGVNAREAARAASTATTDPNPAPPQGEGTREEKEREQETAP